MDGKSNIKRSDILSLNLKEIKRSLPSALETKLIVSKESNDTQPLSQSIVKPWMLSLSNQVFVSRNKVGRELLQHCPNGFILDDPHIRRTRFFVDYHRMHDPGLKRYYNSLPVRNRLKKLEIVTKDNDALCSHKEFVDYLRYLDSNLTYNLSEAKKSKEKKQLKKHFQMLEEDKQREAQFTGIFRRKKYRMELKSKACAIEERKRKLHAQITSQNKAIERVAKLNAERSNHFKTKNWNEVEKLRPRKQQIIQDEICKRIEIKKILDGKLELANQRKQSMEIERKIKRMRKEIEDFKWHSKFRQDVLINNVKLFERYEEEQRFNKQERKKYFEQIREFNENKIIKMRKDIAKKERNADIVGKIMKNIEHIRRKYMKKVDPADSEEVSRRFALLTPKFIAKCMEIAIIVAQALKIDVPAIMLVARTLRVAELLAITVPEIGATKCVLVREKLTKLIAHVFRQIKNDRVKIIKDIWLKHKQAQELSDHEKGTATPKKEVMVDEHTEIIGESSYDEFIGDLTGTCNWTMTKTYNLNEEIQRETKRFADTMIITKFQFSEKFNGREFCHLYDFQKYFLYKVIRRLMELIQIKALHYWEQKYNFEEWQQNDWNLETLSSEAAKQVMEYPNNPNEFSDCIMKLSQFLCIQIDQKLQKENIEEIAIESATSSIQERSSLLSETQSAL